MSNSIAPGSSADVNVRVTALTTNPNVPAQYKTIILKKNLVNGVNTLTQEMMSATNTKYVIKYDYVLGEDITVPNNCILEFDGGSISGSYHINFNNSVIYADNDSAILNGITLFSNIAEISVKWFGAKGNHLTDDTNIFKAILNTYHEGLETVIIPEGVYVLTDSINTAASTDSRLKNINIKGLGNDPSDYHNDTYKNYTEITGTSALVFLGNINTPCIVSTKNISNINIHGEAVSYTPEYGVKEIHPKYENTIAISSSENAIFNKVAIRYFGIGIKQDYTNNGIFNRVRIISCITGLEVFPQESYIPTLILKDVQINCCWHYGIHMHSTQYSICAYIDGIDVSGCGREDFNTYRNIHIELSTFQVQINNGYFETIDDAPNSPLIGHQDHIGIYVKGNGMAFSTFSLNNSYLSGYGAGHNPVVFDDFTKYLYVSGCNAKVSNINAPKSSIFVDNSLVLDTRLTNYEKTTLYAEDSIFYQIKGNNPTLSCYTAKNVSIRNFAETKKIDDRFLVSFSTNNTKYMLFTFDNSASFENLFHLLSISVVPQDIYTIIGTPTITSREQVLTIFSNTGGTNASAQPTVISTGNNYYEAYRNMIDRVYVSYDAGTNQKVIILRKRDDKDVLSVHVKSNLAVLSHLFTNNISDLSAYDLSIYTDVDYNVNNLFNTGINKVVDTNPILNDYIKSVNIGTSVFNKTLGKPVWWNGTAWVDATGTPV